MRQFEIDAEPDRLTLTLPVERRLVAAGCPLFLLSSACLLALGGLSVLQESDSRDPGVGAASRFFNPHANEFGFLWALACLFLVVFVPFYVWMVRRTSTVFTFDRARGEFFRYGRTVTRLSRIEQVRVRRLRDPDGYADFEVAVVYGDGRQEFIDDTPDEAEATVLAQKIADFVGVEVVSARQPLASGR